MSEISKDIKESRTEDNRYSSVRKIDGKYVAYFNGDFINGEGNKDYFNYEKIFDSLEDYSEYLDTFLSNQ